MYYIICKADIVTDARLLENREMPGLKFEFGIPDCKKHVSCLPGIQALNNSPANQCETAAKVALDLNDPD